MDSAAYAPLLIESFRRELRSHGIEVIDPVAVDRRHERQRRGWIAAMRERWLTRRRPARHPAPVASIARTRT